LDQGLVSFSGQFSIKLRVPVFLQLRGQNLVPEIQFIASDVIIVEEGVSGDEDHARIVLLKSSA
jgi:hypothetical protein